MTIEEIRKMLREYYDYPPDEELERAQFIAELCGWQKNNADRG